MENMSEPCFQYPAQYSQPGPLQLSVNIISINQFVETTYKRDDKTTLSDLWNNGNKNIHSHL